MLKNNEERRKFLANDANWKTEYLSDDLKVLTLKLSDDLLVKRIKMRKYDDYLKELRWFEDCTKYYYPTEGYWGWGYNATDYELEGYLREYKDDECIKDLENSEVLEDAE